MSVQEITTDRIQYKYNLVWFPDPYRCERKGLGKSPTQNNRGISFSENNYFMRVGERLLAIGTCAVWFMNNKQCVCEHNSIH